MSTTTINYDNYNFNLLLDDKEIIIKITNNNTLDCYEANLYDCDLNLKSIRRFYNLIISALNKEQNYTIDILEKINKIECKIIFINNVIDVEENLIINKNKSADKDTQKLKQIITIQQNEINQMKQRLEQLENERLVIMLTIVFNTSNLKIIKIPINIVSVFLDRSCYYNITFLFNGKQKMEYLYYESLEYYKDDIIQLNIKNISIKKCDNPNVGVQKLFLEAYLPYKTNFMIDSIETDHNELIEILIKYKNYKKLLIGFDKSYNDLAIKKHCKINNIEFGYIQ